MRRWPWGLAAGLVAALALVFVLPSAPWVPEPGALGATEGPDVADAGPQRVDPDPAQHAAGTVPQPVPPPLPPSAASSLPEPPAAAAPVPDWQPSTAGTAKGATSGTLSLALVLGNPAPGAGEVVPLTITASQSTPATLCVAGEEEGVVWRGDLPEGRTALTTDGQPIGYAFDSPGEYRFALATTDDPSCADPVQRVVVRVSP